jgi:hypothetical protein
MIQSKDITTLNAIAHIPYIMHTNLLIPLASTITAIISLSKWIHGRIACDKNKTKKSSVDLI